MPDINDVILDNGENRLYDSWEILRAYNLVYSDRHDLKPEGKEYEMIDIIPWEGRLIKFNMVK